MNLDDCIREQIVAIGRKYSEVRKISLFGSRARGDNLPRSDIDIAVFFLGKANYNAVSELEDIETLLEIDITVVSDSLSDKFLERIMQEEVVIYMIKFENKLDNFGRAVQRLQEVCGQPMDDNDIMRDSIIQRFEFCYELSWKTLKEYLRYNGLSIETMPRPVYKAAYAHGIIDNQDIWLEMIKDRNVASHEYNQDYAIKVAQNVKEKYLAEFEKMLAKLTS